jgi:hypothetical protein
MHCVANEITDPRSNVAMSTRTTTRSTSRASRRRPGAPRTLAVAGPVLLALTVLTACGGNGTSPAAASTASQSTGAQPTQPPGPGNGAPAADGLLASVDGRTLQVQGTDSQTAVTYSGTTTITSTVKATASDIKVGSCVAARPEMPAAGSSSSAPTSVGIVAAATVTVSDPVDGTCVAGFGGAGGGQRPGGAAGARPSGAPPGSPRAVPSPGGPRGNGRAPAAVGKVTSVDGDTFVVRRTAAPPTAGAGSTGSTAPAPTTVTVTTTNATVYTKTVTSGASALQVGTCVTAVGKADDTGTVAATSIAVRPANGGLCTNGRFGGGAPGGGSGA